MTSTVTRRIAFPLLILSSLSLLLWVPAESTRGRQKTVPVKVSAQLERTGDFIPVELKCRDAELPAPNEIRDIPCVVKNNTEKRVRAIGLIKIITVEKSGQEFPDSASVLLDPFVHADISAERGGRLIPPGNEVGAGGASITYDGGLIKGVSVEVDYVEFEDGAELGPNRANSREKIRDVRAGAVKYKDWLIQRFNGGGRRLNMLPLLVERELTREELGLDNSNQEQGAIFYQNHARKIKETKGLNALAERLQ